MLTKLKPRTNGSRHYFKINKYVLSKKSFLMKTVVFGNQNTAGRSINTGHRTIGHKGSGKKRLLRDIQYLPTKNVSIVVAIAYDPFRSSFISLCFNFLTNFFYNTIASSKTYPGTILFSYATLPELRLGSIFKLEVLPMGALMHSIATGRGPAFIRAAGTFGILVQKKEHTCIIKMPSGVLKEFSLQSACVLGGVSNMDHAFAVIGKAGRARHKNRRPHVRGVAMNPVDHPHGGQTSGGRPSVTPWGIPTKGKPTVH